MIEFRAAQVAWRSSILSWLKLNDDKMMTGGSDECCLVGQTLALIDIQFLQLDWSSAQLKSGSRLSQIK